MLSTFDLYAFTLYAKLVGSTEDKKVSNFVKL